MAEAIRVAGHGMDCLLGQRAEDGRIEEPAGEAEPVQKRGSLAREGEDGNGNERRGGGANQGREGEGEGGERRRKEAGEGGGVGARRRAVDSKKHSILLSIKAKDVQEGAEGINEYSKAADESGAGTATLGDLIKEQKNNR